MKCSCVRPGTHFYVYIDVHLCTQWRWPLTFKIDMLLGSCLSRYKIFKRCSGSQFYILCRSDLDLRSLTSRINRVLGICLGVMYLCLIYCEKGIQIMVRTSCTFLRTMPQWPWPLQLHRILWACLCNVSVKLYDCKHMLRLCCGMYLYVLGPNDLDLWPLTSKSLMSLVFAWIIYRCNNMILCEQLLNLWSEMHFCTCYAKLRWTGPLTYDL